MGTPIDGYQKRQACLGTLQHLPLKLQTLAVTVVSVGCMINCDTVCTVRSAVIRAPAPTPTTNLLELKSTQNWKSKFAARPYPSDAVSSPPGCLRVSPITDVISSLLAAGRAELRRTQLTRSSRRHIEGAAGCRLTTQCYGAQLRWKGWLSIYLDPQPTLSTFQVGGNRSTQRKPTTFGRALTNSSHMNVASPNRDSNPRSQR